MSAKWPLLVYGTFNKILSIINTFVQLQIFIVSLAKMKYDADTQDHIEKEDLLIMDISKMEGGKKDDSYL